MIEFSEEEIKYLLTALLEREAYITRLDPYPEQKKEIKPYKALIQKMVKYRAQLTRQGSR